MRLYALAKGHLPWTQGTVTPSDSYIRISTLEVTQDIRPHRVAWKGPVEFSVSGVERRGHLQRVLIRFRDAQAAQALFETIRQLRPNVEVAFAPEIEKVPIFVRFRYPRPVLYLSLVGLAAWIGLAVWAGIVSPSGQE